MQSRCLRAGAGCGGAYGVAGASVDAAAPRVAPAPGRGWRGHHPRHGSSGSSSSSSGSSSSNPAAAAAADQQQQLGRVRGRGSVAARIHIDRRRHLELAWERQQAREALLAAAPPKDQVLEIVDLEHLESVLEKAGSQLLVLCLYTSSCGACKLVLQRLDALRAEASRARTRVVFARHNVIDEYDAWSDIARWHKARAVPTILFFDGGALVQRLTLRDVRRMGGAAAGGDVRRALAEDVQGIGVALRRLLFKAAPGARP